VNEIFQQAASLAWFDDSKGWPATVTPEQAIALQCRRLGSAWSEYTSHPDTREMTARVSAAVKAGALELTTITEKKPIPPPQRRVISPGVNVRWGSGAEWPVRPSLPQPTKFKEVTTHRIAAQAFAALLAVNEVEPSRHVAAWFKSQGVNTAAAQPQAAAPRETTAQRNNRWLLEWDKHGGAKKTGAQAQAIASIAAGEGVNPETVKKAMQKAVQARIEGYREQGALPMNRKHAKPASPFDVLTKKR
jgi:hypothetical protein